MEQGDTEPRNEGSLRAGKDREKGPPLEPPEGMQSFQHTDFFFFFLAAFWVSLRCCMRAFSSCSERGLLFVVVCRFLIVVASLVAELGL